jgi:hypothetical protein
MTRPFCAAQDLHDLALRYALAVDRLDPDMLAAQFAGDGVMHTYGDDRARYVGAAGCAQMIAQVRASFARTQHNVFNQTFEMADDGTITGLTTGIASHVLPHEADQTEWTLIDFAMRYHNRYAREHGQWKFAARGFEVVWVERRTVAPFSPAMLGRELRGF